MRDVIQETNSGPTLERMVLASLADEFGKFEVSFLGRANDVADGTSVFLLSRNGRHPFGVVLRSSPQAPGMVDRLIRQADVVRTLLDPSTAKVILHPLAVGTAHGLSYAVLPYCRPLSQNRIVWTVQRAWLRRAILDWLLEVNKSTVKRIDATLTQIKFVEPLLHLASLEFVSGEVRLAAKAAVDRLKAGIWIPRVVLMHGDFWKGNILIPISSYKKSFLRPEFAVIDWAGSQTDGYGIFDLVRMAHSLALRPKVLRAELLRHSELLVCGLHETSYYCMAALGHLAMNLEHFPVKMYQRMTELCYRQLAAALG
jgi:hypothetical protein